MEVRADGRDVREEGGRRESRDDVVRYPGLQRLTAAGEGGTRDPTLVSAVTSSKGMEGVSEKRDEPKGGAVITNLDHVRDLVLHHDCANRNTLQRFPKGERDRADKRPQRGRMLTLASGLAMVIMSGWQSTGIDP